MKNLHYLKKFVVMVLAAMMTLSTFALPTFAAVDQASFTVSGLDKAASVKAYKVVQISTGADRGAQTLVVQDSISNMKEPTYAEIMALVQEAGKAQSQLTAINPTSFTGGVATFANADPGMYIVTIQNKDDASVVYNPVIVSVNLKDGTGDAQASTFAVADDTNYNLEGSNGTLKKTTIPFDKVVDRDAAKNGNKDANIDNALTTRDEASVNADGFEGFDGNRGDTAGLGDDVWFRINTMVPDYADNFFKANNSNISKDPEFEIYDNLSKGLDLNQDSISLHYYDAQAQEWKAFENGWTKAITKSAKNFKIELTPAGVLATKGKKIEVRYSAKVNGTHGYNYNAETNTGGFNYTRNPGEDCKPGEEKTTYHYTFTVNGGLKGPDTPENREIIKIGTDESGKFVLEETTAMGETSWRPLEGAEFDLYKKVGNDWVKDTTRRVYSDAEGILRGIDRVDAGEYKLKETKAPDGFAKNETDIEFNIEATLDTEGRMTNYKVSVHGTDKWITVGDYNVSYAENSGNTATTIANVTYAPTAVQHTTPAYKVHKMENGKYLYKKLADNTQVEVAAGDKATYDADAEYEAVMENVTKTDFDEAANIRNSKVGTLPSTGGMGTVLFTIGGVVIMGLALLLLFGGKKKQQQK